MNRNSSGVADDNETTSARIVSDKIDEFTGASMLTATATMSGIPARSLAPAKECLFYNEPRHLKWNKNFWFRCLKKKECPPPRIRRTFLFYIRLKC